MALRDIEGWGLGGEKPAAAAINPHHMQLDIFDCTHTLQAEFLMCFGVCWLPRAIRPGTQSYDQGGGRLCTEISTDGDTDPECQDTGNRNSVMVSPCFLSAPTTIFP